jgi:Thioredoxin
MRKSLLAALFVAFAALPARADPGTRDRLSRYFSSWYSLCPSTKVAAVEAGEIAIPGFEAYRVERHCDLKNRNEMSVTLVDRSRNEVFVGEVLHSDERRDRPFSAAVDVPVLEAALKDLYGLPASIRLEAGSRGALHPIRVLLREADNATAGVPGFVSQDGATLLLGEFRALDVDPAVVRERLLSESPGVRPGKAAFYVTAFIDFQCEKCRVRTPRLRDFAWARGGAIEIRFLPLVKVHNWSFAAAESAAALADVSPALYAKFEELIFPRAGEMTESAARQIGADVAEAAGVREAYEFEISSGRARDRVVRDVELALSLGLNSTPAFYFQGVQLTPEPGLAEDFIQGRLSKGAPGAASKAPGRGASR